LRIQGEWKIFQERAIGKEGITLPQVDGLSNPSLLELTHTAGHGYVSPSYLDKKS
jgi:hypothetical protein